MIDRLQSEVVRAVHQQRPQAVYRTAHPQPGVQARFKPRLLTWFVIGILSLSVGGAVSATESLQHWREVFQRTEQAQRNGVSVDYQALRSYPLYPYLLYSDLLRRLHSDPVSEIRAFLSTYADSPLAGRLRNAWLNRLAQQQRWGDYLHDALPSRDPLLECRRRQALLHTGQTEAALGDFSSIWERAGALPNACDPLIAAWQAQGHPSPEQRWQRFALAMTSNQRNLAQFLRNDMAETERAWADAWLAVAAQPELLLRDERFHSTAAPAVAIISDALSRWMRQDALAALAALDRLKAANHALAAELAKTERQLALWIASDYHPNALARLQALPDAVVDQDVREWRIRLHLRATDWRGVLNEIAAMPNVARETPRWRYWQGRSLEALGRNQEAQAAYQLVAGQRDYHGFLAADRIGIAYTMRNTPLETPVAALDALLTNSPGLQRARELYILGSEAEAEAEWRAAIQSFDRTALQQAAQLAQHWEWRYQALVTIARAEYWDDLALRFPLAYRDQVLASTKSALDAAAWIYAVMRQESSFRPDARSPVGALGLMQIMPATGQQIARDLQDTAPLNLLRPEINIRYGAYYLQQIMQRLQNHPVLATAAYNAGPNKVLQWLPTNAPIAADIWAETIPYRETRAYVQRVMEYAAVYRFLLGAQDTQASFSAQMKPILPAAVPTVGASG